MKPLSHSRPAVVAYHDLLRLLLDERASSLTGSVEERQRNGRAYLYERFRIGAQMKSRYLGEATPELRERLQRLQDLKAEAGERRQPTGLEQDAHPDAGEEERVEAVASEHRHPRPPARACHQRG